MSQIRVHLADSDHFSRVGITSILSAAEDITIESVTESMADAVETAAELRPDIIILESSLNGRNIFNAIRAISERVPTAKVVVLATKFSRDEITQAYDAGSTGVMSKGSITAELPSALRMVNAGYQVFARPIDGWDPASAIVRRSINREAMRALNERDRSLVRLVAAGLTNVQIARIAHISEGSVKLYLGRIMDTLNVTNRVQLAVIATESGFVSSADLQIA